MLCLIKHAMKKYERVEVHLHAFITSALDGGNDQLHASAALPPGRRPLYILDRKLGGPQSQSGRGGPTEN
jgi:hypothetical protein